MSESNSFTEDYEVFIERLLSQGSLTRSTGDAPRVIELEQIKKLLRDKRAFGIKKYGDISFQGSYENAMKVDTLQHAREELIDYMNYTLHDIFKSSMIGDLDAVQRHTKRFQIALDLYSYTR